MNLSLVEDRATDARAELRAVRRAHRMISECNQALVRATCGTELLERVCRSVVETGGYRLAWVGLREQAASERLSVAASAGDAPACLQVGQTNCAGPGQDSGPIASALRTGRPSVCGDYQTDPKACACRGKALEGGYGSMIALPLMSGTLTLGVLAIYAAASGAFNTGEATLLEELAVDIAYGLAAQRTRLGHEQALAALRASQETLEESAARYRSLFTNMLNGIAYCRMIYENGQARDFVYLEVNPAFERLTGLKDVVGKKVSEVIPGVQQTNPQLLQTYGRVALTGLPEQFETYVEQLGIWFSIAVYSTALEHFIAVFNNITACKHAAESFRASEMRARNRAEELEKLMDLAPLAIWVADDPGCHRITGNRAANAFYESIPGENVSAGPAVGEHDRTRRFFVNGRELKPEELPMQEAAARGMEIRDRELEVLSPSGKRLIILGNATPLRDDAGQVRGCVGAFVDITERKRAEGEIRRLNESLERRVQERTVQLTALNKELEAFAYSVSHDLRAPLRHIDGFVGLLNRTGGPALNDQSRHYLKQVTDSAKQMGRLIDDLLSFSRMGRAQMSKAALELQALVQEARQQVQPECQGRVVHWNIGHLPTAPADAAMLRQVLVNLLANALKYTRPRDPAEIEIGCAEETLKEVVIFVRDNGVGFDMQYAGKLFGVFQRLHSHEEFEGTGIGLANVRRIIDRHGGRTWAEGKVDGGATFYFGVTPEDLK